MSAVQALSESWDYNPHAHDRQAWWEHHRALLANLEPARWPVSRFAIIDHMTPDEIREIREAYANGDASVEDLSTMFGVTRSHIYNIISGVRYPNAPGPIKQAAS